MQENMSENLFSTEAFCSDFYAKLQKCSDLLTFINESDMVFLENSNNKEETK